MDVNVNGNFYFCKAILPYMIRQHSGNIVNITSIAGKMGDITAAPVYGASKGAINAFTKSLARQLAEYGIRVNAVAPGAMGRLFARTGVRIVHFSTDYVFSGEGSSPWNEASEAHPRQAGVYGVTKHEGERLLEESGVSGAIVRAGWP